MVQRQQLGDIFLGITPKPVRDFMCMTLQGLREQYDRLVIPCAGRFTIAEAAVDAGWAAGDIETSDISLFSSVVGYSAAAKPLGELGLHFTGELAFLQSHLDKQTAAGAVLFGLKLCQLREERYFERIVRDALKAEAGKHVDHLQNRVDLLAEKLDGMDYRIVDCRKHLAERAGEARTVLYVNPPGYAKGYTKMFDTRGLITWADPKVPEFDAKAGGRDEVYRIVMNAEALGFVFRSKEIEPGWEDRAVFAAQAASRTDFVLCNRPTALKAICKRRRETDIKPARVPFLPNDYEITAEAQIRFSEIDRATALYYRDLFAHKLGVTRAERYFMATIDGYLMAVFGMFFDKVQRGQSGMVLEQFGFTVPSQRYPRLNRLFMTAIVCDDARRFFEYACRGALMPVDYFQTTCISTTPEQKTHRGSLKLTKREMLPDGRFKLVYGGAFKPWGFRQVVANWLERMRNVERETGRNMGVSDGASAAQQT